MQKKWLIYGAYGYTGELIAREACRRGMRPVLSGRNPTALKLLSAELNLDYQALDLTDSVALQQLVADQHLVLNCAGPFSATAAPMLKACLKGRSHYVDITGEIDVFVQAQALSEEARRGDVVLLPGAGFDIVPTDCLAAKLAALLPAATRLVLAFRPKGRPSLGTLKTSIDGMLEGGCIMRDGQLKKVPLGWRSRMIPFQGGSANAVTIPWADVFTANISTGIPDVEVYMGVPASAVRRLRLMRYVIALFGKQRVGRYLRRQLHGQSPGPDAATRAAGRTQLWGEVESADGRKVSAVMETPNGYSFTVDAALGICGHLLENHVEGGFYTPSLLLGADFAETLPDVTFRQLD
jgi:short subunit dehydrogenase-like uncharacterized protein